MSRCHVHCMQSALVSILSHCLFHVVYSVCPCDLSDLDAIPFTGLAVYFHLDIERFYGNCGSGEDNESGSACPAPTMEQISVSNQQETLLSRIWSQVRNAINYVLLAIFVAALSHIHHLNHYRRLVSESNGSLHPVSTVCCKSHKHNIH